MTRVVHAFWWLLIGGAMTALVAGFLSGRSAQPVRASSPRIVAAALPPVQPPAFVRVLHGIRGAGDEEPPDLDEPSIEDVVVARATAPPASRRDGVSRLAIVVIDPEGSDLDRRFLELGIPATFALGDDDGDGSGRRRAEDLRARGGEIAALAGPRLVERARHLAARAIVTRVDDSGDLALAVAAARTVRVPLIDGAANGEPLAFAAAQHAHIPARTRDLVADARDDARYTAFMLHEGAQIATRTGDAIVIVRPRLATLDALAATIETIRRDGVELVPVTALLQGGSSRG